MRCTCYAVLGGAAQVKKNLVPYALATDRHSHHMVMFSVVTVDVTGGVVFGIIISLE